MKKIKISNIIHIKALLEGDSDVMCRAIKAVLDGDTRTPWWLICITSGTGFPILRPHRMKLLNCQGILPVAFDDLIPIPKYWEKNNGKEPVWEDLIEYTYLMPRSHHMPEILQVINSVGENEKLVVNCEAGVSRSAAVAYFAALQWGLVPDEIFNRDMYSPNNLVSALLRDASGMTPFKESWDMLLKNPKKRNPWGDETR